MNDRRSVVVTGAAKRVGRAIAMELAEAGCDLVLTARTSVDELRATAEEAIARAAGRGASIRVECMLVDFDDLAATESAGHAIAKRCEGHLTGLVHNASSYAPSPFGTITANDCLGHFRVNAVAPLLLTQSLATSLVAGRGAVVFFSDIHVLGRPRKRFAAYSMSKAATTDLVATLARELAPHVRVNGIAPGVIAWPENVDPQEVAAYERRIPLERPGTPEEAAKLVRWLLLDASYLTGDVVRIDGGRWLR